MKSGVNPGLRRKVQGISDLAEASEHLEWSVVARGQFGAVILGHRGLPIWLEFEEDPITNLKSPVLAMLVRLLSHALLR